MRRVTLGELAAQTDEIFELVESGEDVVVTWDGRDAVRIVLPDVETATEVERR